MHAVFGLLGERIIPHRTTRTTRYHQILPHVSDLKCGVRQIQITVPCSTAFSLSSGACRNLLLLRFYVQRALEVFELPPNCPLGRFQQLSGSYPTRAALMATVQASSVLQQAKSLSHEIASNSRVVHSFTRIPSSRRQNLCKSPRCKFAVPRLRASLRTAT